MTEPTSNNIHKSRTIGIRVREGSGNQCRRTDSNLHWNDFVGIGDVCRCCYLFDSCLDSFWNKFNHQKIEWLQCQSANGFPEYTTYFTTISYPTTNEPTIATELVSSEPTSYADAAAGSTTANGSIYT